MGTVISLALLQRLPQRPYSVAQMQMSAPPTPYGNRWEGRHQIMASRGNTKRHSNYKQFFDASREEGMGGTVKAPQSPHDPWISPRYGTLSLNMNQPMPPFAASLDSPRSMTAPGSPRSVASRGRVAQPTGWGAPPVWDNRHHLLMSTVDRDASRIVRHNAASSLDWYTRSAAAQSVDCA